MISPCAIALDIETKAVLTLTLDFDAEASIVALGNGGFLVKPVIVMTGNNTRSQP